MKKEVKHKIIAGVDKEDLVLLAFTKEEAEQQLNWEHSKEFEFKGNMYDIVEQSATSDSVYYWCWWDKEETVLMQKLYALMGQKLDKDPVHHQHKIQFYQFIDHIILSHFSFMIGEVENIHAQKGFYRFICKRVTLQTTSPPPRTTS